MSWIESLQEQPRPRLLRGRQKKQKNPASRSQILANPASQVADKSRIPSRYFAFSRIPHRILVKSRIPRIPFQTLVRALHRYRRGQGSNPGKPDFFSLSFRNCISCANNCENLLYIYFFIPQFKYMNFIYS